MRHRLMDADGSGAIGSDELSSAFKVAIIVYTFFGKITCLVFAISSCYHDSRNLHACHVKYPYKKLCFAAIRYQGKEVNNRQDDIRCWSRQVRLCSFGISKAMLT